MIEKIFSFHDRNFQVDCYQPVFEKPFLGTRALSGFDGIFVSSALSGSTPTQTHISKKDRQQKLDATKQHNTIL
jgi:hypothetical protein